MGTGLQNGLSGASQGKVAEHGAESRHASRAKSSKLVVFTPGDPDNPRNLPSWKKWLLLTALIMLDCAVSFQASGYSPAEAKFAEDFGVSSEIATLGLSLSVLGLAIGPLSLAPLSEQNIGGTIADLYPPQEAGPAMSFFLWAATVGSPLGFFLLSFVAQERGWRDVFWALLGICGGCWLIAVAVLLHVGETRHSIILLRRAKRLRESTGIVDLEVTDEMKQRGIRQLFEVALTRPFRFLFTEAIIIFGALYNGFLYALSFLFLGAYSVIYGPKYGGYGFDTQQIGLSFLGLAVGISFGPIINVLQERTFQRIYAKNDRKLVPEARLYMGKIATVVQPIALFWWAWTTYPSIHPVVSILASALWGWSFYTLILMTYLYTTDGYREYSASALAGLGVVRNVAGATFPLFGVQMFANEGVHWAGSILAFLSILLVPIPFILARYGFAIRQRSPFARRYMEQSEDGDAGDGEMGSSGKA